MEPQNPWKNSVYIHIGVWWPVEKPEVGCACCRLAIFLGGHVHSDGSKG